MIFHSYAIKTHFITKGFGLSLVLKVNVFGTLLETIIIRVIIRQIFEVSGFTIILHIQLTLISNL